MAILKHIASKSSNYGAALEYLIFKHDELRKTPILDQNGNRIMRDEFYLDGLNCEPYSFDAACQQLNREYQKNKNKNEIKSHHYIISFDPRDSTENCLTGKRAQELGLEYAKANFPGHQALVCTHMDGHNGSGNIHVHIVINSLRKLDVPQQPFMERPIDCKAGYKHHVTNEYLKHLQKSLMDLCQREFLHPMSFKVPDKLLTDGQCRMMINGIQFIQVLLEANGLAAGKDHQFKGRYDAEKNAVIISLEKDEQSALSPQKCTT